MSEGETKALVKTSVSLPRHLYKWVISLVDDKEFNSQSAAMSTALSEMKGRMEGHGAQAATVGEIKSAALEAIDSVQKAAISNEYSMSILLTLATHHPELIEEINDLMRTQKNDNVTTYRKVTFK